MAITMEPEEQLHNNSSEQVSDQDIFQLAGFIEDHFVAETKPHLRFEWAIDDAKKDSRLSEMLVNIKKIYEYATDQQLRDVVNRLGDGGRRIVKSNLVEDYVNIDQPQDVRDWLIGIHKQLSPHSTDEA